MELIKNYNEALQKIYEHVGFEEDFVVCPIDDCTDKFWSVNDSTVCYADSLEELILQDGNYYEDEIYKQRFYSKWVYEGEDFTMIFCNPQVDGMKWFRLFDNSNRLTEK